MVASLVMFVVWHLCPVFPEVPIYSSIWYRAVVSRKSVFCVLGQAGMVGH